MKKVIVKKALDALRKQAVKDQELKDLKGGKFIIPPIQTDGMHIPPPVLDF